MRIWLSVSSPRTTLPDGFTSFVIGCPPQGVEMRIWFPQERKWKKGHSTSYARK